MIFAQALLIIIFVIFMFPKNVFCSAGPKNHKIVEYGDCNLTKDKYDVENRVGHAWDFYRARGKTNLRLVITVHKKTPPVSWTIRGYRMMSLTSERKEDFTIDMDCKNPVFRTILSKNHVNIDMANCTAKPGTYIVRRVNMEEFSRFYTYTPKQYAFYEFNTFVMTKKGVILCVHCLLNRFINS